MKKLALITTLLIITTGTVQAQLPAHPACPFTASGQVLKSDWRSYLTGRVKVPGVDREPSFTLRFTHAKHLGDKKKVQNGDPFGDVYTGSCYSIYYKGNRQWLANGYHEGKKETMAATAVGGDPKYSQFNVWGQIFTFGRNGEVFHPSYGRVGSLTCEIRDDCEAFGNEEKPKEIKLAPGVSTKYPLGQDSTPSKIATEALKPVAKAKNCVTSLGRRC